MKSLLQHASLINKLEEAFNCHVDAVSTGINNKEFLERIRKDGVLLYVRSK